MSEHQPNMNVVVSTVWHIPHMGGISTYVELLERSLRRRGLLFDSVTGKHLYGSLPEKAIRKFAYSFVGSSRPSRVTVVDFKVKVARLKHIVREKARLASGRPLVINTQDVVSTCAVIEAKIPRCAVVQTIHGPWSKELCSENGFDENHPFVSAARRYEKTAFSNGHLYVPVDEGQGEIIQREFGVPQNRIRVVRNSVDVDYIAQSTPQKIGRSLPKKYFIVPRRLVPKNGVEWAVRGFAASAVQDTDLVIAGDGPLRASLEALAGDLGLKQKVHFLGAVPHEEMCTLLKMSVGAVVPSVPSVGVVEATSLSVLEAMAAGVPVIGSSIGGIAEIIADDTQGFLVPPNEAEAVGAAIRAVLALGESSRARLVQSARNRVQVNFGVEQWTNSLLSVYEEALDRL